MNLPALPPAPAPTLHEAHLARQRLYVLSHGRALGEPQPTSRSVQALMLDNLCRDMPRLHVSLLSRGQQALDLASLQSPCTRIVPPQATATAARGAGPLVPVPRRVSSVSSMSQTRPPSLASFAASIGSHATTIRNNMPVYDGASEVLVQARHAPDAFARFANGVAAAAGTPWALGCAIGAVLIWLALGPVGQWSNTWQLVINTSTTIVSFWMLFVVANTQNREAATLSLKIDELMRLQHEQLMWLRTMLPENHPARLLPMPGEDNPAFA